MKVEGEIFEKSPESIDVAWENLANAIVIRACDDYRKSLSIPNKDSMCVYEGNDKMYIFQVIDDCERFFKSEWFTFLTSVDGLVIMESLRRECNK